MKQYCAHCIYESIPHTIVDIPANTWLFLEEEPIDYVYRIQEGLVKINRMHPSGDEKIFDILGPSDYIALLAVLQGQTTYVASAQTLTDTTLLRLSFQDVLEAYKSNSVFKDTCLTCAVTRSLLFQNKLFQATNVDTEEKILAVLQLLANKHGVIKDGVVHLALPFNKTVLADVIGIRRETLSRKLNQMQQHNIISVDKNVYKFHRM